MLLACGRGTYRINVANCSEAVMRSGDFWSLRRAIKCVLRSLLIALSFYCARTESAAGLFQHGMELRGVTVPLYCKTEREPCAILRVDRVYTDLQTKGFFRIGVLPLEVMRGVTIEVCRADRAAASLAELHHWLGTKAAGRLELRDFKLVIPAAPTNRLDAARVRFLPAGAWELMNGVHYVAGANHLHAERATLQVTGDDAGRLILATSSATNRLFLFSPVQPSITNKWP